MNGECGHHLEYDIAENLWCAEYIMAMGEWTIVITILCGRSVVVVDHHAYDIADKVD